MSPSTLATVRLSLITLSWLGIQYSSEETWLWARLSFSLRSDALEVARTFVLLALQGAQPLLGLPQYTILEGQAQDCPREYPR